MSGKEFIAPVKLLPCAAAVLLQQAAQTPTPVNDPLARVKAIDKAIERVKRQCPQFFKEAECTHGKTRGCE